MGRKPSPPAIPVPGFKNVIQVGDRFEIRTDYGPYSGSANLGRGRTRFGSWPTPEKAQEMHDKLCIPSAEENFDEFPEGHVPDDDEYERELKAKHDKFWASSPPDPKPKT